MILSGVRKIGIVFVVLVFASRLAAEGLNEKPVKVTLCQLKSDPAAYNHKLVEVTGFVSHGFENFTLFDPTCPGWPNVWLEYGGVAASGTMYCCGVTADRKRPQPLVVEDIPIPLLEDERFREFDHLIQRVPDSIVHATVVGRFFSGQQKKHPAGVFWSGYGHMGCCSLFAIQQVISVDPQENKDLDYRASADQPQIKKVGCGFRDLLWGQDFDDLITAQHQAELGQREWSFTDPQRVATDALARLLNTEEKSITGIKLRRQAQGRLVYQWQATGKKASYIIVVSRPYWLSFYAKDTKKTAWVVIAAYESSCGEGNSVTRIC